MGAGQGFIQGNEKEKRLPHAFQDAGKHHSSDKGLQILHLISIPSGSRGGREGGCLLKIACFSCLSAIWFQQK